MTSGVSAPKERDTSDVLRRSTRSSRAKPPPEVEEDASGTDLSKSTLGRSKSSGKGRGKGHIEVIEEADEDDIARAVPPAKRRVKGKENVTLDAKVPRPTRHAKTVHPNDTEEEALQPRRHPPKKGRAALDEREESSPDVDSESDVRPVGKRQNRGVKRISSREVSPEEIRPEKFQAPTKKVKKKAPVEVLEPEDDGTDGLSRPLNAASAPTTPSRKTVEPTIHSDSGSRPVPGIEDRVLAPPARSPRSPECTLQHEEDPVTPPPPSSSLLSVSSTTSTTKVEGHTDTETLVEALPVRSNGAQQLTEEERMMTVEQWIRQEIEVQYGRLKRDGETKIRLFKEHAEEVRRQVEAL